jgi:hypothetical protein
VGVEVPELSLDSKDSYVTGVLRMKKVIRIIKLHETRQPRRRRVHYIIGILNWQGII